MNRRKSRAIGTAALAGSKEQNKMANTYEIFIQPNFRDNFDAWNETKLD